MSDHPHGLWIWDLAALRSDFLQALQNCGARRVYLKVFDDKQRPRFWAFQCSREIVDRFANAGIDVWGWGYHFDRTSTIDIGGTIDELKKAMACGLKGYVFDLEAEVKDPSTHQPLEDLLGRARAIVPQGGLAYTSFGNPDFHPEVPWALLNEKCDLQMPQIYYEKFTFGANDQEVRACLDAHASMGLTKPILPIWGSESDTKKPTNASELQSYLDAFPGSSVWRAPNAGERGEGWNVRYGSAPTVAVAQAAEEFTPYLPAPVPLGIDAVLSLGSQGPEVAKLACALMGLGCLQKTAQVGDLFDAEVERAVRKVQTDARLHVDGIFGPRTQASIEQLLARARHIGFPTGASGTAQRLVNFYTTEDGYRRVYDDVMQWFGTTHNGCVAFMSTALRMVGVPVPHGNDASGENISLVTLPFANWLQSYGLRKERNAADLQPGDIVLSTDDPVYAGYPAHTYMFAKWSDEAEGVAWVVDNQHKLHQRNIYQGGGGFNFAPYAYHFRLN